MKFWIVIKNYFNLGFDPARYDTLISAGTLVEGNFIFKGNIKVDGSINGNVVRLGVGQEGVIITETGTINGKIVTDHLINDGHIRGNVIVKHIKLGPRSVIEGDIIAESFEVHRGAEIQGAMKVVADVSKPADAPEGVNTSVNLVPQAGYSDR